MRLSWEGKLRQLELNAIKELPVHFSIIICRLNVLSFTPVEISVASQLFKLVSLCTAHCLKNRARKYSMCQTSRLNVFDSTNFLVTTKANFKSTETEMNPSAGTICKDRKSVKDCSLQHGRSGGLENIRQMNSLNSYLNHWWQLKNEFKGPDLLRRVFCVLDVARILWYVFTCKRRQ